MSVLRLTAPGHTVSGRPLGQPVCHYGGRWPTAPPAVSAVSVANCSATDHTATHRMRTFPRRWVRIPWPNPSRADVSVRAPVFADYALSRRRDVASAPIGAPPPLQQESEVSTLEQSRYLATAIPGPKSAALIERKVAAVSAGVGTTMSVYAARAGGGIVEDVDGNRLIDLGSGIAVTTIGNASPRVVDAVAAQVAEFTHTCFMVTPYEEYVAVCGAAQPARPGHGREAVGAVQLGLRGGRERHQDRPHLHPQAGGRRVRPRLPRPHQPDDGADREVDALQARLRPVRTRDLPRSAVLSVPRRGVRQGTGHRRRAGRASAPSA